MQVNDTDLKGEIAMSILKLRCVFRFASLIAATVIPALAMLVLGKKMQSDESADYYSKHQDAGKVKS